MGMKNQWKQSTTLYKPVWRKVTQKLLEMALV
jgi:hypothetical protein